MPDNDKLTPADPRDLAGSIALALTSGSRLARVQSAEVLATVVAERIVSELDRAGFVVMKRPPEVGGAALGRDIQAKLSPIHDSRPHHARVGLDPELPFKGDRTNGQEARESGRWPNEVLAPQWIVLSMTRGTRFSPPLGEDESSECEPVPARRLFGHEPE